MQNTRFQEDTALVGLNIRNIAKEEMEKKLPREMQQLNNSQRKKRQLDGGGRMRETLLYRPIQEYKKSNKILSCFPFFLPKSDTTRGNHHEPSTVRINI